MFAAYLDINITVVLLPDEHCRKAAVNNALERGAITTPPSANFYDVTEQEGHLSAPFFRHLFRSSYVS